MSTKSEGLFYSAPGRVELLEYDIADPDLYEVQIELQATGLCAWDLALFKGPHPPGTPYPFLHGHEGVGIVRRVGDRVDGLQVGDKVTAMGNDSKLFARLANVPAQYVACLEDDVVDYQHWLAEPVACVANGLEWSHLVPGDRVAVVGTGFMGLMLVQGLRYSLAQQVLALDVDDSRLALALQFGADRAINVGSTSGQEQIEALCREPLDIVIEAAGTQSAFDLSYRILKRGGRLNLFSAQRGESRAVDLLSWHGGGFQVFNTSPSIAPDFARIFGRATKLMQKGIFDLKPLVTHVASPHEAQKLFELAAARGDGYIKGAVRW